MSSLRLLHPKDVSRETIPFISDRVALMTFDIRSTGLLYHLDGTPNEHARPYRISVITSVLDEADHKRPVLYDALDIRIAVPGYLSFEDSLPDVVNRLTDLTYLKGDVTTMDQARVVARDQALETGEVYPFTQVKVADYDPLNPDHGLSPWDAQHILENYVMRFPAGVVVAGQNMRLILGMLDRIGLKLDVLSPVYHRMIEMYSVFLRDMLTAQGATPQLDGIPSLSDMIAVDPAQELDTLYRAQLIEQYLGSIMGVGAGLPIPILGAMPVMAEAEVGTMYIGQVSLTNAGIKPLVIEGAWTSDGLEITLPDTVEGGETIDVVLTVPEHVTTSLGVGTHTFTATIDTDVNELQIALDLEITAEIVEPDPEL